MRIKYAGEFHYTTVEGDYPIYKSQRVSPNQFAYKVAGSARDAWRDVWIKRPHDKDYQLADDLRKGLTSISDLPVEELGL